MFVETLITILTIYVYPAILVLFFFGITIFIHELGHFLVAKRRGLKIERFSIGFGPAIWQWTRDGVEYRVSWIPFGGYVALPQMGPMEAIEGKTETKAEELPPAAPRDKILTAFVGPVMNVVLAFVIGCIIWVVGMPAPSRTTIVGWVEPGSIAEQAGVHLGDQILAINGNPVRRWTEILGEVANSRGNTVVVRLAGRDGQTRELSLEAERSEFGGRTLKLYPETRPLAQRIRRGSPAEAAGLRPGDRFLAVEGVPIWSADQLRGLIGKRTDVPTEVRLLRDGAPVVVTVTPRLLEAKAKHGQMGVVLGDEVIAPGPNPVEQVQEALQLMYYTASALVNHKETGVGVKDLSGPVGIMGGLWGAIAYGGIRYGLWLAVVLNINLAILNLLPIPVLDGGHIVFSLIEWIRRRPLNPKFVHVTQTTFAALLIGFMLYVTVFDIKRFFPVTPKTSTNQPARATEP